MKSSFAPVVAPHSRVIILGSLPGEASLNVQQYYAFKHNAFWRIMESLFGISRELDYSSRLIALVDVGIGLWDVIGKGEREGSLDSSINEKNLQANDFETLLKQHPNINTLCLNGKSVENLFKRHVLKQQHIPSHIKVHVLPSTSPANARYNFEEKLQRWSLVKQLLN